MFNNSIHSAFFFFFELGTGGVHARLVLAVTSLLNGGIPGYVAARACFSVLFFVGARGEPGNEASRAVQ